MKSIKWKDKWFYYKLIMGLLIVGALISVYLTRMITHTWLRNVKYPFSPVLFQGQFLSFFTYQSNFAVGIWFLISSRYHNQSNQTCNKQNIRLALTCYITVTCVTWVFFLLPGSIISGKTLNPVWLIISFFFHIITPLSMIIYTFCHIEPLNTSIKEYYRKSFFLYWIYPWGYTLFLIFRIALFANDPTLRTMPFEIIFPYAPAFKDLYGFGDWFDYFFITFFVIIALLVIVHILFVVINLLYLKIISKVINKRIAAQLIKYDTE